LCFLKLARLSLALLMTGLNFESAARYLNPANSLCVDAAKELTKKIRVVSMPSWELYRAQPDSYKDSLLPKSVPKLSVEAAITMGWGEWADAHVGINCFGASAPGGTCMEKFGFSVANVVACAVRCAQGETGVLSDGSQGKH